MEVKSVFIKGNCIEVMKGFKDKTFDLCLTDPPYNAKNIGPNARVYEGQIMQIPNEEYKKFCSEWFTEAMRVSKTLIFTPGIANVCYYPQPDWIICWHKPAAVSFNRFGGFNAWEPIFVYGKIAKGKRLPQDHIRVDTLNFTKGIERDHPCPKPLELMSILVDKFNPTGGRVLDCFSGSGTTGVACKNLGFDFTGIDIIQGYVDMGKSRVNSLPVSMFAKLRN